MKSPVMKSPLTKNANNTARCAIEGTFPSQRGLSLVELMISITIGLLILASLTTLFVNQSKTRAELDKSNRMIDNGRYAMELLSDSLRMAGYYGEFSPTSTSPANPTVTLPVPCSTTAADISAALQLSVQGYEAAGQNSQIASPPCNLAYDAVDADFRLKAGSDILVIRRASTTSFAQDAAHIMPLPAPQTAAPNDGTIYLQASGCEHDASPYYRMSADPTALTLGQKNITTPAPLNNCVAAAGVTTIAAPYADLRAFKVEVYFVSPDNKQGDAIPTLKRRELTKTGFVTTPLVEGIEYLQIDYGLDSNDDGAPDSYVKETTVANWRNVTAARINILARNSESTRGYADTKTYSLGLAGTFGAFNNDYKRHVYTQFVRLTNPAGRKELQ